MVGDDVRRVGGREWPRRYWPDDPDDGIMELLDQEIGERLFDGDREWQDRLDAEWYEDVEHAFDIEHPHVRREAR